MSNTITNIGRVSERRNPQPVAVVTVEVNGLSLDMLPGEDASAIFAQAEAVIAEKDARPGLGLEPDAAWTPSEPALMEADLVAVRCGLVRPYAYMDAATAETVEDEAIGLEFSTQPYLY